MTKYSKYNVVYRLQKWMDSVPGQTFLNYAYSWGASIVVLGALFKLTHLQGADIMLFIGMGTEVFVFFISAFDRPFDKSTDGMELPTHIIDDDEETPQVDGDAISAAAASISAAASSLGGAPRVMAATAATTSTEAPGSRQPVEPADGNAASAGVSNAANTAATTAVQTQGISFVPGQPAASQLPSQESAETLNEAQENYVTALNTLTETIKKVQEQCEHLTRDSEEMQNLNRTLTGISTIYEMQLKGVSQQVGTIDQINDRTRRMAEQIEQLNSIYARMIEAMTVNMRAQNPGAAS